MVVASAALLRSLLSTTVLFGSTTAVAVTSPATALDVALIVIVALAPALTAPPVHVMIAAETEQTNRLVPIAAILVKPAGIVATTVMPVAFTPPVLFTVSLYVTVLLGAAVDGAVMLIVRSAGAPAPAPLTSVATVAELVKVVLDFAPVTVAVLLSVVPLEALT